MQLADGEAQATLYQNLKTTQTYKGQASGGSAANTTVAFVALAALHSMPAVSVMMILVISICMA